MSRALGAVDRRIDEARARVPISATAIRLAPHANRAFIPDVVYRDLITHVAFLGAPSTGKTTIAERLADVFLTSWTPEFGRAYWTEHQRGRRLTPEQLLEIAHGHLAHEERLLLGANRYLFTDTTAMTTATFARRYHGAVDVELADLAARAPRRYDLVFLCDTDIPYADTADRSGAADRASFQRQVIGDLHAHRVPYVTLRGSIQERVEYVSRCLAGHRKYAPSWSLRSGAA